MAEPTDDADYCPKNFHEMELDDRILKAIAKLSWVQPTLIQERAIPLLLEGKDVLMRARTGSGKTGAFGIPAIQKVLNAKQLSRGDGVVSLILSPSRELCKQIHSHFRLLTTKCSKDVNIVNISQQGDISAVKPLLASRPDIVVSTPGRALDHLKAGTLNISNSLQMLVIDEADLVFSFGHEEDIKQIIKYLPRVYQACLASATLSDQVVLLKKLVLRNAVTLRLEEPHLAPITQLSHYYLYAEEDDKATYLYTLVKLNLLRGKTIIFTNTVDKCYKLKLFLQQFGINVCVLNSELPATVRCHTVAQFNDGVYNIIVASDEMALEAIPGKESKAPEEKKPKLGKRKKDKESGISRGIDFQFVSNVVNFDFPLDVNSYIHRAGRTARGNNPGTALSLISVAEKPKMEKVDQFLQAGLYKNESIFKKYEMKLEDIEGFRYRSRDAWRAATRVAVREARLLEIKHEIINSNRLKGYFEENPRELKTLRHDKFSRSIKMQKHMGDVPDYLLPAGYKRPAPPDSDTVTEEIPTEPLDEEEDEMAEKTSKSAKTKPQVSNSGKHRFRKHIPPSYLAKKSNPLLSLDNKLSRKRRRRK